MKIFILSLILALILQTTFVPINLILSLLCCRALVISNKSTLILSLIFGVLLGVLTNVNIGFYALVFLISIKLIEIFKGSPLYSNLIFFLPILFAIYALVGLVSGLMVGISFSLIQVIFETLISIPVYFLIKYWEERFIVKPHIRLKFKS